MVCQRTLAAGSRTGTFAGHGTDDTTSRHCSGKGGCGDYRTVESVLSIDPILNAYPLQPIIADNCRLSSPFRRLSVVTRSKGPTAKMLRDWNMAVSSATVAAYYDELLTGFIYDIRDAGAMPARDNLMTVTTDTWMRNRADRVRLARDVVAFATQQLEMS